MPTRRIELGPTGRRVAENLRAVREAHRLDQEQVAAAASRLGRPMTGSVVSKTEQLDRRVDLDDLVALSVAVGVSPNRLLLCPSADELPVQLTSALEVTAGEAWRWARGVKPFDYELEQAAREGERARVECWQRFTRENAPSGSETPGGLSFDPVLFAGANDQGYLRARALAMIHTLHMAGLSAGALHKLVDAAAANGDATDASQS